MALTFTSASGSAPWAFPAEQVPALRGGSAAAAGWTSSVASPADTSAIAAATGAFAAAAATAAAMSARRRQRLHAHGRRAGVVGRRAAEASTLPQVDRDTTKVFRRNLQRSEQYFKFGKTQMESAMDELRNISGSDLVTKLRKDGYRLTIGDVTFVLAESYGFCWGVERAVAMAYEARNFFPDKNIWVTNEIIHNPLVNENLSKMGMKFVQALPDGGKDYSGVSEGDVVILPAFGASIDEMAFFKDRNVQIVDTTCPWVSKVWNSVEKSKDKGHTSIIHGKIEHEETVATMSFAKKYLVLKNMDEAEFVAEYILGNKSRDEFMEKFRNFASEGFDPDADLDKVGVANQTTMLKGETELVGKLFERVMIKKFGPQEIDKHFVSFNTICDATQERQDAMYKMFGAEYEAPSSALYTDLEGEQDGIALKSTKNQEKLSSKSMEDEIRGSAEASGEAPQRVDLCMVVGGFNSSNTKQLLEIANQENVPGYHVDCAERLGRTGSPNSVEFKPVSTPPAEAMMDRGLEVKEGFLPEGKVTVGLTSGASTPDSVLGEVMMKILEIKGEKA